MPIPLHWQAGGNVRFADLRQRLDAATLDERRELLTFVRLQRSRIHPRASDSWLMQEMVRYLFLCTSQTIDSTIETDDDDVDTPFEAAGQLVRWFNWYRSVEKDGRRVQAIADSIGDFYRNGNEACRVCVKTGFLEHALECPENRQYFNGWSDDPLLAEAYRESLKRGIAREVQE